MLTEKDYCDYETCVALKELGYIGSSRYYYTQRDRKFHCDAYNRFYTIRTANAMGYVLAIHLYEAQKWLREKGIFVFVGCPWIMNEGLGWSYDVCDNPCYGYEDDDCLKASGGAYDSYEEALLEGVRTSIKLLKEEK